MTRDEQVAAARALLDLYHCPRCVDGDLTITAKPPVVACSAGCADVAAVVETMAGRLTGDGVRLEREALIAVAAAAQQTPPLAARALRAPRLARMVMSSIRPRDVEWLWTGRIPRASVVSIDGLPASGKSSLATEIVACVTTGRALYGAARTAPQSAIWIGHEEGMATALRPRLDAAAADPARVYVYGDPPSFPAEYEWLSDQIRETGSAIVVIDPIDAYLDFGARGDSHRNGDVRARLVGLGAVAEDTGATIVMIRHWRKSGGTHALYRAAGSIAYSALARATISVVVDPDDPTRRLAAWAKLSDAPEPASIAFRLGDRRRIDWIGEDPRSATAIMAAADAAVSGSRNESALTATDAAEVWLMEQLELTGAVPVNDLKQRAAQANVGWRTIERAKDRLGVRARREGGKIEGRWLWVAPGLNSAKNGSSAAFNEPDHVTTRNSRRAADLGDALKTANDEHRQTTVAAFNEAEVDAFEEIL